VPVQLIVLLVPIFVWANAKPIVPARVVENQLKQSVLEQVLDVGPQRFISSLRVDPAFDGKRFVGYRLIGFTPDSPVAAGRSVVSGDIIVAVNGLSLERPDQFMKAWQSLRGKPHLDILIRRGNERILFRWVILP